MQTTEQLQKCHFRPRHLPTWALHAMLQINPAMVYPPCLSSYEQLGLGHDYKCLLLNYHVYGEITWDDGSTPNLALIFNHGLFFFHIAFIDKIICEMDIDYPFFTTPAAYGFSGYDGCVMIVFSPCSTELANVQLESN